MRITKKMIVKAIKLRACEPALAWLEERPRTLGELSDHHPEWAAWALRARIIKKSDLPRLPWKKGERVTPVGGTALGCQAPKVIGRVGKIVCRNGMSVGVDFGDGFDGHNLGGVISTPTGFWFWRKELKKVT